MRNASRLVRSLRAQLWRRLVLLTAAAVALGWLLDGPVLWIGLFVLFACALSSTAAHRRRARRHDNLIVASIFSVPVDPG